ncbi:hypothetical protein LCGC14_1851850 [marine sediment metagenome]|uniref:HTH cro/C1-type domain-containing protein n=1 Tax=marine sediment metagenome TaxID=412755 RepID=A0A0F9GAE5_9ZZZZ
MSNKNTEALISLKQIGFPLVNIRKSFPKLIGTSQPEMARRRNISRANITAYINGRGNNPAVKEAIASELDVPVDDFFCE